MRPRAPAGSRAAEGVGTRLTRWGLERAGQPRFPRAPDDGSTGPGGIGDRQNPRPQRESGFLQPGGFFRRSCLALLALVTVAHAQPSGETAARGGATRPSGPATALPPLVVAAARTPVPVADLAVAVDLFSAERLRASPGRAMDAVLRESPSFSLFRRSGSLVANPTAQGVSLRGLGPSGASRSLVLLDGVPLNDPFGGWVAWGKVPGLALAGAEILRGGGSAEWGNAALGGTVALFTEAPPDPDGSGAAVGGVGSGRLRASVGRAGTAEGEWFLDTPVGRHGSIRTSLSALTTAGDFALSRAQRGPVDRRLDLRQRLLQTSWHAPLRAASRIRLTITVRGFDEERGNGTERQRNASREQFASAALAAEPTATLSWTANIYAQRQDLRSVFTAVDSSRRFETPANDQFSVPSTAGGANTTVRLRHGGAARATSALGADIRVVRGETREDFLWSGTRFTRRRFAGGAQQFAGVFASHDRTVGAALRASAAVRLDRWSNTDGHRREWDSLTLSPTRDDRFTARRGTSVNPRIGFTVPLRAASASGEAAPRLRASASQAFRLPTLNEYYRPFRVGNVNTEANPLLDPERVRGIEAGLDAPLGPLRTSFTVFRQDLRNAVANVTLARTPALVSRQRRNLEAVRVDGVEAGLWWEPSQAWAFRVEALLSDASVRTAVSQVALEGRRLAQVPRFVGTAGASWRSPALGTVEVRLRHASSQYEDDENLLRLEPATWLDVQWSRPLLRWLEGFVSMENVSQASIQTGRTPDGLVTLDAPRRFRVGVRSRW